MNVKVYAPVLITTLNRSEHLKRCINSLEKCTGADKTVVYVALDFPPSEKYKKGWLESDEFLKEKENCHTFKDFIVIRRERNYGIGAIESNISALREEIRPYYDCFIDTEDDNEFSPNFLEYTNTFLELFKNDNRVIKVCAYNFPMEIPKNYYNNFYLSKRGCAWGTGSWFHKQEHLLTYYDLEFLQGLIKDRSKYMILKQRFPRGIELLHSMLKTGHLYGDAIWEIYCAMEDTYFVLPTLSKVRNHGNDGSGVHRNKLLKNIYDEQIIDNNNDYKLTTDLFTYEHPYSVRLNDITKRSVKRLLKKLIINIDLWLLRHFNFLPKSKYI